MSSNVQGAALANGNLKNPLAVSPSVKSFTNNEKQIFRELCNARSPMKAYALLENLRDKGIRAPMTVYRALDALIDKGVVKKVVSLNAYAAVQEEAPQTVGAFVTCRRCGETREVSLSESTVVRLLEPSGMAVDDIYIEAYGDCGNAQCTDHK